MNKNKILFLKKTNAGFSLMEVLVVLIMSGILMAAVAPNFVGYLALQRLGKTNNAVVDVMRQAQNEAKRRKEIRQASFRQQSNGQLQWAVHAPSTAISSVKWNDLDRDVLIDDTKTTLFNDSINNVRRIQFNYNGNINGQVGKITFKTNYTANSRRCVIAETLIGSMRQAKDDDCN